ncbi:MAG: hypothetical protein JXQ93_13030 [Flavobacteriaceae bacterium]
MQNKTSQYIKYAIGEIALVMIGILLALQVNNWNEKRIEKNEIRSKLIHINDDIKNIRRTIEGNYKTIDSVYINDNRKTLTYLKSRNKDSIKKLKNTLNQFGSATSIVLNISSVEDFIKSGYISKINNVKLKNNMLTLERLKVFSMTLDNYANNQLNIHISPYFIKKLNFAQLTKDPNMIVINPVTDFSTLIGDKELENLLNLKIETDTSKLTFLLGVKSVLDNLEEAINEELGK